MSDRREVFAAIDRERSYQDRKWGGLSVHPHEVGAWLTILRSELREAEEAWARSNGDKAALREILQIASVAVACLEQHGVEERDENVAFSTFSQARATWSCPKCGVGHDRGPVDGGTLYRCLRCGESFEGSTTVGATAPVDPAALSEYERSISGPDGIPAILSDVQRRRALADEARTRLMTDPNPHPRGDA